MEKEHITFTSVVDYRTLKPARYPCRQINNVDHLFNNVIIISANLFIKGIPLYKKISKFKFMKS